MNTNLGFYFAADMLILYILSRKNNTERTLLFANRKVILVHCKCNYWPFGARQCRSYVCCLRQNASCGCNYNIHGVRLVTGKGFDSRLATTTLR